MNVFHNLRCSACDPCLQSFCCCLRDSDFMVPYCRLKPLVEHIATKDLLAIDLFRNSFRILALLTCTLDSMVLDLPPRSD